MISLNFCQSPLYTSPQGARCFLGSDEASPNAAVERALPFRSVPLILYLWGPVVLFGQVAGLGQTARVQRGPSEAARCASNGTPCCLPSEVDLFFSPMARRDLTGGADLGVPTPLHTFSPSWPVSYFRAGAGRLSERDQSAVGLPLLLSCNGCRRQWRRMFEATLLRSKWCGKFSAPRGGEA